MGCRRRQTFAHVSYCPIKISVPFNNLRFDPKIVLILSFKVASDDDRQSPKRHRLNLNSVTGIQRAAQ